MMGVEGGGAVILGRGRPIPRTSEPQQLQGDNVKPSAVGGACGIRLGAT